MRFRFLVIATCAALMVTGSAPPGSAQTEVVQIDAPRVDGLLLDWCRRIGQRCGQPAADAFCRANGYRRSVRFVQLENPGKPTRTISRGEVCDGPECDSFKWIQCQR